MSFHLKRLLTTFFGPGPRLDSRLSEKTKTRYPNCREVSWGRKPQGTLTMKPSAPGTPHPHPGQSPFPVSFMLPVGLCDPPPSLPNASSWQLQACLGQQESFKKAQILINTIASAGLCQPDPQPVTCLIASLQVKVTGLGVETQVNAITVVPDDVLGSWVLAVPPAH